ncbi:MAG: nucleotidyl transferase AbiEii/AbiGii toxin family protein [Planctomycetes bacterium]|nr:nucleotidyl transferase AbiEii/AbiGii toxin family protein [Planctomycetota bacterium]
MFPPEIFRATLEKLVRVLEENAIRFHLTGGVTSIAYGEPRLTQDIDVVIDPERTRACLPSFMAAARREGFVFQEDTMRAAVARGTAIQLLDADEALKLDLYPRELIPGELDRAVQSEVFQGLQLPIASLPDCALSKLVWIQRGSAKSRRDLKQLLLRADPAERVFIEARAVEMGLDELLADVESESDDGPS